MPIRATIVRLADGGLWVHSPTPLSPELVAAVEALGPVRDVVAPSRLHDISIGAWGKQFPGARLWAAPGLPVRRPDLTFAACSTAPDDTAVGQRDRAAALAGAPALNEVVFFHAASRTLVCTDLLFNIRKPATAMTSFVLTLAGTRGRFAMSRAWWRYARDRPALKASVEQMLEWDFTRVIPAHGEIYESDSANGDTRDARRAGVDAARSRSPRGRSGSRAPALRRRPFRLAVGAPREAPGVSRVHRLVARPGPAAELRALVVGEGLLDLVARVHHERAVLHDRLADRAALQQQDLGLGRRRPRAPARDRRAPRPRATAGSRGRRRAGRGPGRSTARGSRRAPPAAPSSARPAPS